MPAFLKPLYNSIITTSLIGFYAPALLGEPLTEDAVFEKDAIIDSLDDYIPEKSFTGFSISLDNDLFVPGSGRDQDYTAGTQVSFTGSFAKDSWYSLAPMRKLFDGVSQFDHLYQKDNHFSYHSMQLGLLIFTPSDIGNENVDYSDRPFANMLYVSNSKISLTSQVEPVYTSNVTLGLIGSSTGVEIQRGIHKVTGSNEPDGWDHQVSEGGELTAQYTVSRQALLSSNFQAENTEYELKYDVKASLGYLTETAVSLSGRWGILNTPWWAFTPENSNYASQTNAASSNAFTNNRSELFIFAGVKGIARAYNVFLQGQFRESDFTYRSDELNHVLFEAWVGVTTQIGNTRLSYVVRSQSKEIKQGAGARHPLWGGLIISVDL